jgi:hypothetical protein
MALKTSQTMKLTLCTSTTGPRELGPISSSDQRAQPPISVCSPIMLRGPAASSGTRPTGHAGRVVCHWRLKAAREHLEIGNPAMRILFVLAPTWPQMAFDRCTAIAIASDPPHYGHNPLASSESWRRLSGRTMKKFHLEVAASSHAPAN